MGLLQKIFGTYSSREMKNIKPIMEEVLSFEEQYAQMSEEELKGSTARFKERLAAGESLDDITPEAIAAVREAAYRVIGQKAFPVQIIGAVTLNQGRIAEMKTGEGKTLTAALAAYVNALAGGGVHVVTVNDYLAKFHSEWMGKIYNYMGLSVGLIVHGKTNDERRAAYACDITYGTNNEFGFDYLRDNMVIYKENKVQRGFAFAIVDEVDSILIDEARTPLIISGQGDKSTDLYERADKLAKGLKMLKIREQDDKESYDDVEADYIVDEKARTATLTPQGIKRAEQYFGVENITDADNMTLMHHVNQAIKAHGVMTRDIDYVVREGEVIIVDEFTGRLMLGRRYNEGLHQAIEAKEGVKVERESKTLATITFQNYFRMYRKLSGMTGTALTEEDEFREIYNLDVIEIPTNRPVIRKDHPDVVYKTEKGKFNAVIEQIIECHQKEQPVLVGTVSIEKSELLSAMLKKRGIKHEVLNAKRHEKEAEIVAQAGRPGAVTIATNMAGRGTDIILGGNAEFLAKAQLKKDGCPEEKLYDATSFFDTDDEETLQWRAHFRELLDKYKKELEPMAQRVKDAGGLFIIGTERHESRRIDNQLRGRSGRQGDAGESRFYISLEDDLMRLFGGERMQMMMDTLGVDEDMPLEYKMLSGTIESAQRKIEGRNFGIRKRVLEYDDVMNRQREIIYGQRDKVLNGDDIKEYIWKMTSELIDVTIESYLADSAEEEGEKHSKHTAENRDNWNIEGLKDYLFSWLCTPDNNEIAGTFEISRAAFEGKSKDEINESLKERAEKIYSEKEKMYGEKLMREIERVALLRSVDSFWMEHIDAMEELKRGIGLRGYAQRNPVVEYRMEGFDMFDQMVASIREQTVKMMFTVKIKNDAEPKREEVAKPVTAGAAGNEQKQPVKKAEKVGRNDPCPCGSGKKYKKCCGQ